MVGEARRIGRRPPGFQISGRCADDPSQGRQFSNEEAGIFQLADIDGEIDAFFNRTLGKLPYRSVRFEHEHLPGTESYQATAAVNYPNDFDFTRITEFKKMTGQNASGTSIVREYPQAEGDPYYPVPRPENHRLFSRYWELGGKQRDVTFVGRLAEYRYYNMDQAVGSALKTAERLIEQLA